MNIPPFLRFGLIFCFAWLSSTAVVYVARKFIFKSEAPAQEVVVLAKNIEFDSEPQSIPATLTTIDSPLATWTFSTHGASLEQVVYKREQPPASFSFLPVLEQQERERRTFLVALDQKTPYYYTLKGVDEDDEKAVITYAVNAELANIEKTYTVDKRSFKIDLTLKVTPKGKDSLFVRLFYPAPHLQGLGSNDVPQAVVRTTKGSITKTQRSSLEENDFWSPVLFGVEDKFFTTVLFKDSNSFVNRAYYRLMGTSDLLAVVQGPPLDAPAQWQLSFYVGPKEEKALNAVDTSLDGLLDYSGILAPISKILFKILHWIYEYVHNYGWAIILLTFLINLALLPLNIKRLKSMKKSTELQKKMEYIKQRYKNDPEAYQREQADLLAKHGMPILGGCLPQLIQFPIFFALSKVLTNSLTLYQAPFMFWIKDLSAADPYYVLPIIILIAVILQSSSMEIKQRMILIAFALFMATMSAGFAAGACLYMVVGFALNALQNYLGTWLKLV